MLRPRADELGRDNEREVFDELMAGELLARLRGDRDMSDALLVGASERLLLLSVPVTVARCSLVLSVVVSFEFGW